MNREKLETLAAEKGSPCVTISMNTHRTHPQNAEDTIVLGNLLKETEARLINEFEKSSVSELLKKIKSLNTEIDVNYNLDSLHIFLSDSTKEIIKSPWPTPQNTVHISEKFAIRPLIKLFNRTEEYLILLLSQSGAKLSHAVDDSISEEIVNENFPFTKDSDTLLPNQRDNKGKLIDGKQAENLILEFFNKIDKAIVKVHNKTNMNCVVICTDDNYSRLMQAADKPTVYLGNVNINHKEISNHNVSTSAWEEVKKLQELRRAEVINEMQEASGHGKVLTVLEDIFRAAKEGRGELLVCHDDFHQAVKMTGEFSFDLVEDSKIPAAIDDITSEIAWEVISKKGRVIFTNSDEIKSVGEITLKVRY
ncbi:MAG: hypothetical protein ABI840_09045 [bacterium]